MLSHNETDMLQPLVEPLSIRAEDAHAEDSEDDEVDAFAADAVDAEAAEAEQELDRRRAGRWLASSHRFGLTFDPNRPIYRVWTNIRGSKVHALVVAGVVIVAYAYFGYRGEESEELTDVFTLHVVAMLLAWAIWSDGLVAYRAGMIGSNSIEQLRLRHRRIMLLGALCLVGGVVAIITHKIEEGHSLVPHTYHGTLGVVVTLGMVPQVRVGMIKFGRLVLNQGKSYRNHGNFGQLLYAMTATNVALGFLEVDASSPDAFWVFCGGFLITTLTVIAAMYQPTIFGGDQFDQIAPTRDITEHDVELVEYEGSGGSEPDSFSSQVMRQEAVSRGFDSRSEA